MSSQRWQGVSVVRLKQQHVAAQLAKQNSNEFKSSLLPGPALLNPAKSDQQLGNGIQIEAVVAPIGVLSTVPPEIVRASLRYESPITEPFQVPVAIVPKVVMLVEPAVGEAPMVLYEIV